MAVRSIYSTNGGMDGYPLEGWGASPNSSGRAVAMGHGGDGRYSINIIGFDENSAPVGGYALVDREEMRLIYEALSKEFLDG